MVGLRNELYEIVAGDPPMTVRQVFYLAVSRGLISKTDEGYQRVQRRLGELRLDGTLPYGWIVDNTRWMRKTQTFKGMRQALEQTVRIYRRSVWDDQDAYVEVWSEKDAIAGILSAATAEWDVPIMVCRGFPSITFLHDAARAMEYQHKPCHLYYFGDYDPSGLLIARNTEERLRQFAPGVEMAFEVMAVTPQQIVEWGLPMRPTKRRGPHARGFEGDSVEVDAITPAQLRELARSCVERHIDPERYQRLLSVEAAERNSLGAFLAGFPF